VTALSRREPVAYFEGAIAARDEEIPRSPTPSSTASFTTPIASSLPARACASAAQRHEGDAPGPAPPDRRRDKAVDNDGLRYSAMKSALRPSLPTASPAPAAKRPSAHPMEANIHGRLTELKGRNIIAAIRGSKRQVADIKSEPRPASNRNRWPAWYWNAWPTSSESAVVSGQIHAAIRKGRQEEKKSAFKRFVRFISTGRAPGEGA